ncbi:MAG: phosphate ABC transporter permease subunit PstC [Burkholderiales bacterium]|nr:phosphate ABC transporter permease subunit PstC [Phycisphaerae bacterium]
MSGQRVKEFFIEGFLFIAGASSILITLGIVFVLLYETIPFFAWQSRALHLPEAVAGHTTVSAVLVRAGDEVVQGTPILEAAIVEDGARKSVQLVASQFTRINEINVKVGDSIARDTLVISADERVRFTDFFGDRLWAPVFDIPRFGIWSLITGTLVTTAVALMVAVPAGTISAIWLSEYCNPALREWIKPTLELLAAVPTVVYGYFALLVVTPLLQRLFGLVGYDLDGFNMLSAGLVMGIMIIPYIASLSEDAMRAVPMQMREGSYAMGATRFQTAVRVLIPAALSGMTAAYILAISRAVGETMIVALAAGLQSKFTLDPTESAATISAAIVQAVMGDLPHESTAYRAVFAAGLGLMIITLFFNIAGHMLRKRYREAY